MSLYTLGVHLQILLAVGLAVLCYALLLGCIFCCRKRRISSKDKEAVLLSPPPAERVSLTLTHPLSVQPVKQQYEELEGDVLEFPSSKSSTPLSEDDLTALPFDTDGSAESKQPPSSLLPTRRLSTPALPCSPCKAAAHGRPSLPSLIPSKLSFVSKPCRVMGRRSTVSGESLIHSESSPLTAGAASAPTQQGVAGQPQYGSNSLSSKRAPLLHFSLLFSSASGTLLINILGLSGDSRRRSGVFVRVSLPPLYPSPQQRPPRRRSLSPDLHSQSFVLQVGSVEELLTCTLRLAVYSRDFSGLREASLGEVELLCEQMMWKPDTITTYTRQLSPSKSKLKKRKQTECSKLAERPRTALRDSTAALPGGIKNRRLEESTSSLEMLGRRKGSVCVPRTLGQLLILLQYQVLSRRIKVMVRKAENLTKLTWIPGTPDHYIVINLRQDGKIIDTKETKGSSGPNPIWNAPFLFDVPPGDITELPLALEFIIMQGRLYTKSSALGRVLIGSNASEAGREHWREMCNPGQTETTQWHTILLDSL